MHDLSYKCEDIQDRGDFIVFVLKHGINFVEHDEVLTVVVHIMHSVVPTVEQIVYRPHSFAQT